MTDKTQIVITAKDETGPAFKSVESGLNQIKGAATTLVPVLGGIGAALTVGAFAESVSNTIKFAAALDDMAERTGASVENLSALSGVAKIGGHDLGMVEQSVIRLNKALHGSDDESKGAAKAIEALGLSIEDLRSKDPAQAMLEVAQALDKFQDGGGKSAVAIALLGKAGAQALPFLKDLAEKSELVGKITSEQAAQAEIYEKNLNRLSASFSTLARTAAMELIPALANLSSEFVAGTQAAGGFWSFVGTTLTTNPFKSQAENLKSAQEELAAIDAQYQKTGERNERRVAVLQKQVSVLRAIDDERKKIMAGALGINDISPKKSLDDFNSAPTSKPARVGTARIDEATRLIQSLNEQITLKEADAQTTDKMTESEKQAIKVRYQLETGTLKATASQRASINADLDKLVALDKTLTAQKEYQAAVDKQESTNTKAYQSMLDQIALAERQTELYGLTEAQISVVEQARLADAIAMAKENGAYPEHIAFLEQELDRRAKLSDVLSAKELKIQGVEDAKKALDAVGQLDEFTKSAAKNMQSAFADFLFDPFAKGADKMAQQFGQTVQRMIAEAASAQIMEALFGDYSSGKKTGDSGLVGGLLKSAGAFDWKGLFGFANGGIMTSAGPLPLRAYAGGGIANSPQLTLFGEGRTPEAYVPLPDGRRIPVAMQGGSGNQVVQHLNFYGAADPAQVKRAAAAGYRSAAGAMATAGRYA